MTFLAGLGKLLKPTVCMNKDFFFIKKTEWRKSSKKIPLHCWLNAYLLVLYQHRWARHHDMFLLFVSVSFWSNDSTKRQHLACITVIGADRTHTQNMYEVTGICSTYFWVVKWMVLLAEMYFFFSFFSKERCPQYCWYLQFFTWAKFWKE